MKKPIRLLFLFMLAIEGCGLVNAPSPTAAPPPASATAVSTQTEIAPTMTVTETHLPSYTPRPTATPIAQSSLGQSCWTIHETFPNGIIPDFRLALLPEGAESLPYLMDFSKGEEIDFPGGGTKLIDVRISPDGRWLSGKSLELKALYVVDATGKTYKKIPYQAEWGTISHWINDSTIIIQENDNYPLNALFAINPFTQEVRELPHLFPDIDKIRSQPWDYSGLTIYDPTLQLVVYPELSSDGNVIVLWDLGKNDSVVRLQEPELNPNPMPRWSQDGEKFVFTGLNDHPLTLIYRDGRIKNSEINLDDDFVPLIDLTSWSPDGRYLAFWIEPRDDHDRSGLHLMVWDTRLDRVIDTCIPSDVYIREIGYDNLPLWSPDGKYLAVKTLREVHQEQGLEVSEWDVEVIDFQNELTVKVAKNSIPLGWLTR